jgi:hypothetical protein
MQPFKLDNWTSFDAAASLEVGKMKTKGGILPCSAAISRGCLSQVQLPVLDPRQMRASVVGAILRRLLEQWMMDGRSRS